MFAVFIISTLSANASLYNRGTDVNGNRLIYDSDLNITWYDYTKSLDNWWNQMSWASALTVNFGGIIFNDWRLPSTVDGPWISGLTFGYNITTSEMGHLSYTELRNKAYCDTAGNCPQSGWGLTNTGDFQNLKAYADSGAGLYYWSETERADGAYVFGFWNGKQTAPNKLGGGGVGAAIAVRSGDVTIVPEPISSILFVTGGTLLMCKKYLKKAKNNKH